MFTAIQSFKNKNKDTSNKTKLRLFSTNRLSLTRFLKFVRKEKLLFQKEDLKLEDIVNKKNGKTVDKFKCAKLATQNNF